MEKVKFLSGHRIIYSVAPRGDEQRQRIVIYNYETGEVESMPNAGRLAELSPDGQWLITTSMENDDSIDRMWHLDGGITLKRTWKNQRVSGLWNDGLIRMAPKGFETWSLSTILEHGFNPPLNQVPKHYGSEIPLLEFAFRIGSQWLIGIRFENSYIWDFETGDLVLGLPAANAPAFAQSQDGSEFAMSEGFGEPNDVCLIPTSWFDQSPAVSGINHIFPVNDQTIAIFRENKPAELLDARTMQVTRTLNKIPSDIWPLRVFPSADYLIGDRGANRISLIQIETGEEIQHFVYQNRMLEFELSPDASFIAFVFADPDHDSLDENELVVLDCKNFEVLHREEIVRSPSALHQHAFSTFSADGTLLAVVPDYNTLYLYDTSSWTQLRRIPNQHRVIGWIEDGRAMLTWDIHAAVVKTNLDTWEQETLFHTTGAQITSVLTADHQTLIMGGHDGRLRFWNLKSKQLLGSIDLKRRFRTLELALDGTLLYATTVSDKRTRGTFSSQTLHYWKSTDPSIIP